MSISSSLTPDGKELTIKVEGRFDFSALQAFKSAYEKALHRPESYIVDLSEADYLDSSALGMLLALRNYAGDDDANIRISHCNPDVRKILLITKLDELFKVD